MDKVRLGFIGAGGMGQMAHLRNYVTLPDCEVAAVAELREDMGKLVSERYGIPKVYRDHREMLAKEKLDGIVASQPFNVHDTLLPEIFGNVKNVFTEKPITVSVEAGERLVDAAAKAGTTHMVGYHKRSDPASVHAKTVIEHWKQSGKMGLLKYVRILMPAGDWIAGGMNGLLKSEEPYPVLEREKPLAGMDEKSAKAYVEFVNYYIHQVNYMRFILGEPYRVTFADKGNVMFAVESASGVTGVVEMSPYRTTLAWEEEILVAFEKGYVKIKLPAPLTHTRAGSVEIYEDPGNTVPMRIEPTLPWTHAMLAQAQNFVKVCKGEMVPSCGNQEAVEDLKVAREYIRLRYL